MYIYIGMSIIAIMVLTLLLLLLVYRIYILSTNLEMESQAHLNTNTLLDTAIREAQYQSSQFQYELEEKVQEARIDSLKKSKAVLRGQATEHLAPYMWEGLTPQDARWIGQPIDYLVIDGLSHYVDTKQPNPFTIYLIDIKTNKSSLSATQRMIRDAIKKGRVVFGVYNPDTQEFKMTQCEQMIEEEITNG